MTSYALEYEIEAIEDIKEIISWYNSNSAMAVNFFLESLIITELSITRNPFAFSATDFNNIRKARIKKFPYNIFYMITESKVQVLALIHAKRSNNFIRKRLK
jgi:hypothetical protein